MAERNAYAVLGLRKGASDQEIKQAYIEMVKRYDPEKHTERFMIIQGAYKRLQDPKRRAKEDILTFNPPEGEFHFLEEEKAEEAQLEELNTLVRDTETRLRDAAGDEAAAARATLVRLLMRRSFLHVSKKLWAEAIRDWNDTLKHDPSNVRAKNNLVFAYVTLGHSYALHMLQDEAAELWEKALQMNPDNVEVIHNLALCYEQLGDREKSQKYWTETIRRWKARLDQDPENEYLKCMIIEVHRHHGGAIESGGEGGAANGSGGARSSAIEQYREVLRLNPTDFEAHFQICQALMDEQKREEAAVELERLSRAHPKNVEVMNLLGWAQLNSGQVDNAFHTWRRSLAVDPKNYATKDTLVRAHLMMGKKLRESGLFTPALVHFKQLLKYLGNNSPEVHMELGITFDMKGDIRSAAAEYTQVIQLDPKNKIARKALTDLKLRR